LASWMTANAASSGAFTNVATTKTSKQQAPKR
jgi:hypothetical protein